MRSDEVTGDDRLPMPATLTPQQQAAVDGIVAGPRGALIGPFVPLLRSPELMTRLQLVGEHLRFGSTLPAKLREIAILVVARQWDQGFEWGHHAPLAREAGVDEQVITAIGLGHAPPTDDDARVVWRLVTDLIDDRRVGDATFESASRLLGDTGVVELVALIGYYTTLAMTMNAARTPIPVDYERLPRRS
jgi:4-carboxymuconolactone decarboxylase